MSLRLVAAISGGFLKCPFPNHGLHSTAVPSAHRDQEGIWTWKFLNDT